MGFLWAHRQTALFGNFRGMLQAKGSRLLSAPFCAYFGAERKMEQPLTGTKVDEAIP